MKRVTDRFLRQLSNLPFLLLAVPAALRAQTAPIEPRIFAKKYLHFLQGDLSAMERGEALARILDASDPLEVPPFGVIRVNVPAEFFLAQYRDIAKFKRSKEVLQIAKLSAPPRLEDFETLTLELEDIESLKKCRVGDCSLKLEIGLPFTSPGVAPRG